MGTSCCMQDMCRRTKKLKQRFEKFFKFWSFNNKNKKDLSHPNLSSALRPVPHGDDSPVPIPIDIAEVLPNDESSYDDVVETDKDNFSLSNSDSRGAFSQAKLNDLVRDLNLSKISSELLGSRLKAKN
ncbi:hypothetical protein HELRODRAFT_158837 [Helobdella robusta]|uniref:Uncharacterized protein n=1 Tax=Helobdella robusta TaxID=6412 RepID=T1ENB7_HELRO|nr:hypothetical protein HELRODRAFT_158837 [Helobdella robusta]ESO12336.1 hypothetical protein HELRODRAFT_158837 [Helobdella robusta]